MINIVKTAKKDSRHIFLLLYWPLYLGFFFFTERFIDAEYTVIECGLDRIIPFCEFFIIPYVMWYFYLVWIHLYTLIYDVKSFKKLMYFIIICFSLACVFFVVFPNCQILRPETFPRDNIFTNAVKFLYTIDTNTNVCPSLHVAGSLAVLFTAWNAKGLNKPLPRILNIIITALITISTLFLKQHSLIDAIAAIILCAILYPIVYILPEKTNLKGINISKKVKISG